MADVKCIPAATDPPPSYENAAQRTSSSHSHPNFPPVLRPYLPLELPILNALRGKRIILASASPRRRQLLAQIGLINVEVIPSSVPEDFPKSLSSFEYVLQTATRKAMTVYAAEIDNATRGEPALVIAADTIVVSNLGQLLEKPHSEAEHITMLKSLRNTSIHKVYTAVVAMAPLQSARDPGYSLESTVEETIVRFGKDISDEMIMAYVRTREGADKAGGYGIQGIGAILVDRIDGSFDNVVGLPLRATLALIEKVLNQQDDDMEDEFAALENE